MEDIFNDIISLKEKKHIVTSSNSLKKIGYISTFVPEEIFYAANLLPFLITGENVTAYAKSQAYLHRNFCSYILSCFEEGLNDPDKNIDGLVIGNTCDAARRLYDTWKYYIKTEYMFFLDIPKIINEDTIGYFENQLRKLIASLEIFYNCKITKETLLEAITLCNESRKLLYKLYTLRANKCLKLRDSEFIDIYKSSMQGNKNEFNSLLLKLITKINTAKDDIGSDSLRLLLCGSYFDNKEIMDIFNQRDARIICEDTEIGISNFETEIELNDNPIKSLATYYLNKPICSRILDTNKRFNHIDTLIKKFHIQGVIYFSLKFCDNNLMEFPFIKEKLDNKNIPILFIEGEKNMTNISNIKTRIDAFIENMLF